MGIDYKIVNDDKKQFISGDTLYGGCCKWKATFHGKVIPSVLTMLLANEWKGDRIRVLNDIEQQRDFKKLRKYDGIFLEKYLKEINTHS